MKPLLLAAFLLAGSLAAQAQTTPPAQNGTNAATLPQPTVPPISLGPPTNQSPVVTQPPINQATIDVKDQAATDTKVQRAVTGTGPIQTDRAQATKMTPAQQATRMKPSSNQNATKSRKFEKASGVTTQPTTPPRP